MLTQIPTEKQLLPLGNSSVSSSASTDDVIYIPDRETVMKNACLSCVDCSIYSSVLDAATGAQAATMMAMREATDNVKYTIAALELEISKNVRARSHPALSKHIPPRKKTDFIENGKKNVNKIKRNNNKDNRSRCRYTFRRS